MDNLATQVYALISGAVMATVNAIFFCKLYICFKLKRRRFSTLQSSILSYFALLFAFCSMILVERIINLIEDNQRVTTPGAIALISAFNTVVILSANSAVAIFFMSNITHLFKDTYLAINSLLLKSLLCITLILTHTCNNWCHFVLCCCSVGHFIQLPANIFRGCISVYYHIFQLHYYFKYNYHK
eukprot:118506_1